MDETHDLLCSVYEAVLHAAHARRCTPAAADAAVDALNDMYGRIMRWYRFGCA